MDSREFGMKMDRLKQLVSEKDYATALRIVDGIDWNRVKSASLLTLAASVYEENGRLEDAKDKLVLALERSGGGKRILYKLTELAVRGGNVDEATDYYREYNHVAPDDPSCLLLQYMILKCRHAPYAQLIKCLELYNEYEPDEKWMYELATTYEAAGRIQDAVNLCDRIAVMFGNTPHAVKALKLKQKYAQLTEDQRGRLYPASGAAQDVRYAKQEPENVTSMPRRNPVQDSLGDRLARNRIADEDRLFAEYMRQLEYLEESRNRQQEENHPHVTRENASDEVLEELAAGRPVPVERVYRQQEEEMEEVPAYRPERKPVRRVVPGRNAEVRQPMQPQPEEAMYGRQPERKEVLRGRADYQEEELPGSDEGYREEETLRAGQSYREEAFPGRDEGCREEEALRVGQGYREEVFPGGETGEGCREEEIPKVSDDLGEEDIPRVNEGFITAEVEYPQLPPEETEEESQEPAERLTEEMAEQLEPAQEMSGDETYETEKAFEAPSEKASERASEKASERTSERASGKAPERASGKAPEGAPEKATEEAVSAAQAARTVTVTTAVHTEGDTVRKVVRETTVRETLQTPTGGIIREAVSQHRQEKQQPPQPGQKQEGPCTAAEKMAAEHAQKMNAQTTGTKPAPQKSATPGQTPVSPAAPKRKIAGMHLIIEALDEEEGISIAKKELQLLYQQRGTSRNVAKAMAEKLNRIGNMNSIAAKIGDRDMLIVRAGDLDENVAEQVYSMLAEESEQSIVLVDTPEGLDMLEEILPETFDICDILTDEDARKKNYSVSAAQERDASGSAARENDYPGSTDREAAPVQRSQSQSQPQPQPQPRQAARSAQAPAETYAPGESYGQNQRYEKSGRYEESERYERPDRYEEPERYERPDRYEEPERYERPDRYEESERYEKPDRYEESERYEEPERYDEPDRYEEPKDEGRKTSQGDREGSDNHVPFRMPNRDNEVMDASDFAQYCMYYANDKGCSFADKKSRDALYEKIEIMEEEGVELTKAAAEDLIEDAADHAEHPGVKGAFRKKYDKDDMLILRENDFIN